MGWRTRRVHGASSSTTAVLNVYWISDRALESSTQESIAKCCNEVMSCQFVRGGQWVYSQGIVSHIICNGCDGSQDTSFVYYSRKEPLPRIHQVHRTAPRAIHSQLGEARTNPQREITLPSHLSRGSLQSIWLCSAALPISSSSTR